MAHATRVQLRTYLKRTQQHDEQAINTWVLPELVYHAYRHAYRRECILIESVLRRLAKVTGLPTTLTLPSAEAFWLALLVTSTPCRCDETFGGVAAALLSDTELSNRDKCVRLLRAARFPHYRFDQVWVQNSHQPRLAWLQRQSRLKQKQNGTS